MFWHEFLYNLSFLFRANEESPQQNGHHGLTLLFLIMQIIFLLQGNIILLHLESSKERFAFHDLSSISICILDICPFFNIWHIKSYFRIIFLKIISFQSYLFLKGDYHGVLKAFIITIDKIYCWFYVFHRMHHIWSLMFQIFFVGFVMQQIKTIKDKVTNSRWCLQPSLAFIKN